MPRDEPARPASLRTRIVIISLALLLLLPGRALSTDGSPFLSDELFQILNGEISGDAAFETIRVFTRYHRPGNSPGFTAAADFVYEQAVKFGLEDVVRLKQPVGSPAWSAQEGSLWIISPVMMKLADLADVQLMLADNSRSVDLEAELVDVGDGTDDTDYEGVDVAGKVVFAGGNPAAVTREAVFERGAAGVVTTALRSTSRPWDHPDQIPWQRVPSSAPQDTEADSWFGFTLSARQGDELRTLLRGEGLPPSVAFTRADPAEPVRVRVRVRSTFDTADTDTEFIEARIRGTDPSLPAIVFTCHVQEEKFSANDDASGCANVLEIGRAIRRLIDTGMIERPRRTLRFWFANEISGPYWYFRTHPEERDRILATLHQDMVGAKQTEGSRVQHIIRSPHHQASFLADVVQNIAELVIRGNSGYLAAGQAGNPYPFSRPIYSRLGTRDGYRAEIVPNFNNSDHMVFNDGIIGIPAVGFINWPDDYIHSSDDDLWQIDPTQLKRNAFIIAAAGLWLADAGPEQIGILAAEVFGRAAERQAKDLRVALAHLASAEPQARLDAYKTAGHVLEAGLMRESRALESLRAFAGDDPATTRPIVAGLARLHSLAVTQSSGLDAFYRSLTGEETPELDLDEAETAAASKVPANIDDVDAYLSNRPQPATGLHSLMTFATWGNVDGETSYLDIYKQVLGEAMVHGAWYYGTVTLEQVVQTLDAGVEAGILTLQ